MNLLPRIFAIVALLFTIAMPPLPARAACGSLPYVFTNNSGANSIVDANTTNANNSFLQSCATSVDFTQIGPNGIYASQIVPTTIGQATFGGSQPYTFLTALNAVSFNVATASKTAFTVLDASSRAVGIGSGCGAVGGIASAELSVYVPTVGCLVAQDAAGDFAVAGNVVSGLGVFAAPSGTAAQLCANYNCSTGLAVQTNGTVQSENASPFTTGSNSYGANGSLVGGILAAKNAFVVANGTSYGTWHWEIGSTFATTSGITITFKVPFVNSPYCGATPTGNYTAVNVTGISTTQFIIGANSSSSTAVEWYCAGP